MLNKLSNKKGVISIIYIILIFISVIIIMGFVSITNKTIAINEIQGIMDVSGVIALRKSVDETEWRLENLVVDTSKARNDYINLVNGRAGEYVGEGKLLKDFNIESVKVVNGEDTVMGDIKDGIIARDQYYLEGVAVATYNTYNYIDRFTFHTVKFFDFLWTGDYSSVAVGGKTEDGDVQVIIRTVSRLALR